MKALNGTMMAAIALLLAASPAGSTDISRRTFTGTVDFVQHVGRSLPAELTFRDERGTAVRLGDYLGTSPSGLLFAYFGCTNLCPLQIRNLALRLAQASGAAANQAQILVVSIDPLDTPARADRAKHKYLDDMPRAVRAERWHFLSGAPADIAHLTQSVGFSYGYDPATRQYAHAAGFTLITPEGRIARYFFGFDFTADELGRAFDQAAAQRIASPIERLLLVCFHYDLASGPYNALIMKVLRVASTVMLLGGLLALVWILVRRARRARTLDARS